jgi:hypothetical protein
MATITAAPAPSATFVAEHDTPIPCMQRPRHYSRALAFPAYRRARFAQVPFTPRRTPLSRDFPLGNSAGRPLAVDSQAQHRTWIVWMTGPR